MGNFILSLKARTKFMWRQEWNNGKQVQDLGLQYLKQTFIIGGDHRRRLPWKGRSWASLATSWSGGGGDCSLLSTSNNQWPHCETGGKGSTAGANRGNREEAGTLGSLAGKGERRLELVALGIHFNMFWWRTIQFRKVFVVVWYFFLS